MLEILFINCKALLDLPEGFSSQGHQVTTLSLCSQRRCSSLLINFVIILWTHCSSSMSSLCWEKHWMQRCTWDLSWAEGQNPLPHPLSPLGDQSRTWLFFCAVSTDWWVMSNFPFPSISKSFTLGCSQSIPSAVCIDRILIMILILILIGSLQTRTLHLALLSLVRFMIQNNT